MAAKCVNCAQRIVCMPEFRRYHHKHSGSAFCGTGHRKAKKASS